MISLIKILVDMGVWMILLPKESRFEKTAIEDGIFRVKDL